MSKDICVIVEGKDGAVRKASLELLSKAKEITEKNGAASYALVIGHKIEDIVKAVQGFADKVIFVDSENLKNYRWDTYTTVIEQMLVKYVPSLVFGGATIMGKDLFPRLAGRLNTTIVSDAVGIAADGGSVRIKKPLFGGKVTAWVTCIGAAAPIITFRPNSFSIQNRGLNGAAIEEHIEPLEDPRLKVIAVNKSAETKIDLQEADFIICGGRGMKGPENFQILEEIAEIMTGRVGASRAVVDSKWRDYEDQVGKSGKTVSPKLYVGCAVSGALHHTMGMDTSRIIVAINKDPNAPIFNYADYGIVDDVFNILPILKEELIRAKQEI
jgi:electron transfer flavoprotein alpha subunit